MLPKQLSRTAILLLAATALAAPGAALAQQRPRLPNQERSAQPPDRPTQGRTGRDAAANPNVTVQDRARPEYDPIGLRAGSFFIYPQVTLGGFYDDNVFASDDDEEGDFAATVQPRILVQSNFSRHQLLFDVGGDITTYAEEDDLNYQDVYARGAGRLDITRDNILNGSFGIEKLHEDPSSPDEQGGGDDEITEYYRDDLDLSYRRSFNRLYALVGGSLTRLDFQDSDDTNEDDRDRNQYQGRVRAGYEISPRLGAFAQATYDVRRYDQTPDDEGLDRDSDGFGLRAGTEIDITSIIFGEVGVGYTYRKYEDDELDSVSGVGFGGSLTWNVTPLTSVILNTRGDIQETTVGDDSGDRASANFQKLATLDVTHELLRNVLLNANAGYIRDDFEGIDRSDNTFVVGGGVSYLLNRNLSLDATYDFSTRRSDEQEEEYSRNIFLLGVTARL
jgi:hypothetical protein